MKKKQAFVGFDVYSNPTAFTPKSQGDFSGGISEDIYDTDSIETAINQSNNEATYMVNGSPLNSDIGLSEMYRNYVNSVVCGLERPIPPWNEFSTYEDVARMCYNNNTNKQLHELELLEDRCLSMGLDPTGGGFKIQPGTRFLSSSNRPYFRNGQPIPEAFQYDEDAERTESFQKTGQFDARPIYTDLYNMQQRPMMVTNSNYEFMIAVGQPVQHNYQTVPFPKVDMPIQTSAILPTRLQEYVYVPQMNVQPPKDNSEEELKAYEARKYAEEHKQEIFNQTADLQLEREKIIQQLNSPWLVDKRVVGEFNSKLQNIQKQLDELSKTAKTYNSQEEFNQEINMLKTNWLIKNYNQRLVDYEHRSMERYNVRRHPEAADSMPIEEINKNSINQQWFREYGSYLTGENRVLFQAILNKQQEIQRFAANFDRRKEMIETQKVTYERYALALAYQTGKDYEKILEEVTAEDPFGFNEILKRPEYATRASIKAEELSREKPEDYPDYIPRFDKREKDLNQKEKRLLFWSRRRKEIEQTFIEASELEWRNSQKHYVNAIDVRRCPFTARLMEIQDLKETDKTKRGKIIGDLITSGLAEAEAAKVPRHLDRMYDHREFGETLQNYGLKTKIGALSDLLSEYDTNDSFKEAMNKGLLSIDTPDNLGRAYNRDRVEFDNSIIEQFNQVNRPLPDDDDAWIKNPEFDPYHSTMTIEDITKEEYDKTLSSNGEYTMWVTKELGGTYDATKQHSN